MSTDKLTRKEMRNPDAFQRVTTEYWSKLAHYKKPLLIGVSAFFGLFLALALVSHFLEGKSAKASAELSRALEVSRRGVEGSLDPAADPDAPKFKTAKEKNEEFAKQLDQVRKQFPSTEAALTATAYYGDAQFNLGNLDEAVKSYEEYLKASKGGEPMRALVLEGVGYVYEAKKDYEKALDAFDRMSKEAAGEPNKARAALHRARVLELTGKKQEAAAAFQKVKDDFKEAPAAREATERLGMLAAQGVPVPKPAPVEAKTDEKK